MKVLLASLLALTPVSASAEYVDSRSGYAHTQRCYRSEYREEYIPGSEDNPGYVKSWKRQSSILVTNLIPELGDKLYRKWKKLMTTIAQMEKLRVQFWVVVLEQPYQETKVDGGQSH